MLINMFRLIENILPCMVKRKLVSKICRKQLSTAEYECLLKFENPASNQAKDVTKKCEL